MRWRALCCGVALTSLVACGKAGSDVSDAAAATLQPRVAEIRDLATAGQADQAAAKLDELRLVVADLQAGDQLSDRGAMGVLAAADAVAAELALVTTTTPPTTTPPTTVPTTAPPPPPDDDDERDRGDGRGGERKDEGGEDD